MKVRIRQRIVVAIGAALSLNACGGSDPDVAPIVVTSCGVEGGAPVSSGDSAISIAEGSDTSPDAGQSELDSAAQDRAAGDAASSQCASANDCVDVEYFAPVMSEADCYCRVCPSDFGKRPPINRAVHEQYEQGWMTYCAAFKENTRCFPQPCPLAPPTQCSDAGVCAFAPVM